MACRVRWAAFLILLNYRGPMMGHSSFCLNIFELFAGNVLFPISVNLVCSVKQVLLETYQHRLLNNILP